MALQLLYGLVVVAIVVVIYAVLNDKKLSRLPPEAKVFSPLRFTAQGVRDAFKKHREEPVCIDHLLPPKTGRRYIVVGGAGFLGGWIVLQLLQRGEDPKKIRVLDVRLPTRADLRTGKVQQVTFLRVDITDAKALSDAFQAPWPEEGADGEEITVFHSAANIRFYERLPALFFRSTAINYEGTKNVIASSKEIGAGILIYTSSGSVAVRRTRFWLWPWENGPQFFVQVLNDDDNLIPKRREHFFSNYAASKRLGELAVRAADKTQSGKSRILRTGCIRPGNGIFGPGGDILCGAYLVRRYNPTWVKNILQSYIYVENCALGHLCYEQRLLELQKGGSNPDIGGQAFNITDAGPPCTFGDVHHALSTLDSEYKAPDCSFTFMLSLAHIIEGLYVSKALLSMSDSVLCRAIARIIPAISGDLVNLQPSTFALAAVHLVFDDTRARLSPSEGGLGYNGPYTTLQGICKTADAHFKAAKAGEERSLVGGVSLNFKFWSMSRGVGKLQKSVEEQGHSEAHHLAQLIGETEAASSVLTG
ncbi:3-beta hydroxysteroid dehydrogenase/isomerase family-domain-containing protein [Pisolithus croceorrhizus]|nr:3-beta hydroxysteroid dehydrogenase/isomerase family-domain-containing protein [Pisolithus croceorrhizus]KAI6159127.1 3-beta hydroxysteroid dehydrogenase/isomerase family-domain-containing protein [Pisolithus thermaeus]